MYIKSSSEPPEQPEVNQKNGLRGGFPIKINGHALGSQESLQDFGSEVLDRSSLFGPRVRSRQNSVSRIYESVDNNRRTEPDMFFTPFGPAPGQGSGFKTKSKPSAMSVTSSSANMSEHSSMSRTRNVSKAETSSMLSQDFTDQVSNSRSDHDQVVNTNINIVNEIQNNIINSQIDITSNSNAQEISQEYESQNLHKEYKQKSDELFKSNFQVEGHKDENSEEIKLTQDISSSTTPQVPSSPFMFQRPKAFQRSVSGSFGSQLNLLSSNHGSQINLFSSNYGRSSNQLSNHVVASSQNIGCSSNESFALQIESKTENHENVQYQHHEDKTESHKGYSQVECRSEQSEHYFSEEQTMNKYHESFSKQEESINQIHESLYSSQEERSNKVDETYLSKEEVVNQSHESYTSQVTNKQNIFYSKKEIDEFQRSTNTFPGRSELDYTEVDADRNESMGNDEDVYVKEYNVVARVVLNPNQQNNATVLSSDYEQVDKTTSEEPEDTAERCNTENTKVKRVQFCYDKMEETEMFLTEDNVTKSVLEEEDNAQDNFVEENQDMFIQQKDVINSCIEELENASNINEALKTEEVDYEDVNFTPEQNIDSEDLEHVHVKNFKTEARRNSLIQETVTSTSATQSSELVEEIKSLQQAVYTSSKTIEEVKSLQKTMNTFSKTVEELKFHQQTPNTFPLSAQESQSKQQTSNASQINEEVKSKEQTINISSQTFEDVESNKQINNSSRSIEEAKCNEQTISNSSQSIEEVKSHLLRTNCSEESLEEFKFQQNVVNHSSINSLKTEKNVKVESSISKEDIQNIEEKILNNESVVKPTADDRREENLNIFLTETDSENDIRLKLQNKRERNRTIDYHNLPSLYWEASVHNYHEKKYVEAENKTENIQNENDDEKSMNLAKDGLSIILQKLQEIECKLDTLKSKEAIVMNHAVQTPEPGRLSVRCSSLPDLSTSSNVPIFMTSMNAVEKKMNEEAETMMYEKRDPIHGANDEDSDVNIEQITDNNHELSSTCSTPTLMEIKNIRKEAGFDSDTTEFQDSDCEGIIDEILTTENEDRETYKPFNLNIMEISDVETSEDEDPEERTRRIEQLAAAMTIMNNENSYKRAELNMDIDTLSEMSEEDSEKEQRNPRQRSRRPSGRKRSMSRERSVAKIRYCWRCHKAGHENWQCREEVQPGGWCPRCLETSHWEDECWVSSTQVVCPICNLPGHLPCIHQATDFRQRKLVIDTFGWLPFKEWFQDLTFRSWWNCSGYTGVPLYKILQRNPEQDLDLGFEE